MSHSYQRVDNIKVIGRGLRGNSESLGIRGRRVNSLFSRSRNLYWEKRNSHVDPEFPTAIRGLDPKHDFVAEKTFTSPEYQPDRANIMERSFVFAHVMPALPYLDLGCGFGTYSSV